MADRLVRIVAQGDTAAAELPRAPSVTGEGTTISMDNRLVRIALLDDSKSPTVQLLIGITIVLMTVTCVHLAGTALLDCMIIHRPTARPVLLVSTVLKVVPVLAPTVLRVDTQRPPVLSILANALPA